MSDCDIGDEGVAHLRDLKQLRRVVIHAGKLSDQSMYTFALLPKLTTLRLSGNGFTNEGLAVLRNQTGLVELNLNDPYCRINDDGLKHLAGMTKLKVLALEGSRVSDAGLKQLDVLPSLSKLSLGGTNVTWGGADQWKKTLDHSVKFDGTALKR